jgi:HEAT repeat protein/tetratricopeptide (TPR) repeat protein
VLAESDEALPSGILQALLTVALTEVAAWEIVDRERLRALIAEQGLAGASGGESALALGRLAKADALLAGTYRLRRGEVRLALRLLAVADGSHLAMVEVTGTKDDPEALARQAAEALAATPEGRTVAATGGAAQRALEAKASSGGHNRFAATKAAAFIGPSDPKDLADLGLEHEQRGNLDEALNCYRRALDLTEGNLPLVPRVAWCLPFADGILRRQNRPQERVRLWQRAISLRGPDQPYPEAALMLAEALYDTGDKAGARDTLQRFSLSPGDPRVGALLERLGDTAQAVDVLLAATWFGGAKFSYQEGQILGPAYAGVIRGLDSATPEQRAKILGTLVERLGADRPAQALRAAAELRQTGPVPLERIHAVLDAGLAIRDTATVTATLADLQARGPANLALLNELAASSEVLRRHGRPQEAAALAKRALSLSVKGGGADVTRTRLERRLKDLEKGAAARSETAPLLPGIDEAFWQHLADRGGRATAPDSDLYALTETGFLVRAVAAEHRLVWQYDLGFGRPYPRPDPDNRGRTLKAADQGFCLTQEAVFACNFFAGVLHAVDAATGKRLWSHTEWTAISPPLLRPQHGLCVCVANSFGELVILAAKDGRLIRRIPAPEVLHNRYCEDLPDIAVIHDNEPGAPVHWTDWVQIGFCSGGGFVKRNYYSQRGDQHGLVYIDANLDGTHAYNMASEEVKITDIQLQGGTAEAWKQAVAGASGRDRNRQIGMADQVTDREEALPTLLRILRDPKEDPDARARTLGPIVRSGQEQGIEAAIEALNDESYSVRSEASRALRDGKDMGVTIPPSALGRIAQIAHAEHEGTAVGALHCLVRLGGIEAKSLVQDILDGPESERRTRAGLILADAGDKAMIPLIRPLLRDDLPAAQQMGIVRTLSALGEPTARALYLSTIDTAQWLAKAEEATRRGPTRTEIHEADMLVSGLAASAPDERLVPFLEELSKHYQGKLRARICYALGRIGAVRSVPFLIDMLPSAGTRRSGGGWDEGPGPVTSALLRITGQACGEKREDWQRWWNTHQAEFEKATAPAP